MPTIPFLVVGMPGDRTQQIVTTYDVPANVRFLPPQEREALAAIYANTSVYLQLSRTEGGLPMVLGEAMLSGCIPVASRVGGMPDTVGDAGFLVDTPEPARIAAVVSTALELGSDPHRAPQVRAMARQRIVDRFHIDERERKLTAILSQILTS